MRCWLGWRRSLRNGPNCRLISRAMSIAVDRWRRARARSVHPACR
jgi:hypothetical protein